MKGTLTVVGQGADAAAKAADKNNTKVTFENFALFTDCIRQINNKQFCNAILLHVITLVYNLIEYGNSYSKPSGSLRQYYKDEPDYNITDSNSFEFQSRFLHNTDNTGTVNVETAVPLKYVANCWRTIEMSLIMRLILF